MKKVVVLGGGGFISTHLAKKDSAYVITSDLKKYECLDLGEVCNEFILGT